MKRFVSLLLAAVLALAVWPASAMYPPPSFDNYLFQPNNMVYHQTGSGTYVVAADGTYTQVISNTHSALWSIDDRWEAQPDDGWVRYQVSINGIWQPTNLLLDQSGSRTKPEAYPTINRELPYRLFVEGQNGMAVYQNGEYTLYMKPGANLRSPRMWVERTDYDLTSLDSTDYRGGLFLNDRSVGEKLASSRNPTVGELEEIGTRHSVEFDMEWTRLKNAEVDLSKDTWLFVCGTVDPNSHPFIWDECRLIKVNVVVGDNPIASQATLVPRQASHDTPQSVFTITDYTKQPRYFTMNDRVLPDSYIRYTTLFFTTDNESLFYRNGGKYPIDITVHFTDGSTGTVRITEPNAEPEVTSSFSDIENGISFVEELAERGVVNGSGGGRFRPYDAVNLAELCVMLTRAEKLPFKAEKTWYDGSLNALKDKGVFKSIPANPNANVTEPQLFNLFMQYLVRKYGFRWCYENITFEGGYEWDNSSKPARIIPNKMPENYPDVFIDFVPSLSESERNECVSRVQAACATYRFMELVKLLDA